MDRSIRMAKSNSARTKRKSVKELKEILQNRLYMKSKKVRKKIKKINNKQNGTGEA